MVEALRPAREWHDVDAQTFRERIASSDQPAVLRGVVRDWPAVERGKTSATAIADYIKGFDRGSLVHIFYGEPSIRGRFFYTPDLKGFNFERRNEPLAAFIDRVLASIDMQDPPSLYAGAAPVPNSVPEFAAQNQLSLLPTTVVPRIWIGNKVTVSTHYDLSANVACVIAGRRRFTFFPPHQLGNLYVGPLDFTLAGQPVSLVDLSDPDYARYPRFRNALQHAMFAELEPGDAVYIPHLWWHHVESLDRFNVLVNYWWDTGLVFAGSPFLALAHALLAIRHLPPSQRDAWRAIFEHYIFSGGADSIEHLPADARGVLGTLTPELARSIKMFLIDGLGGNKR